MVITREILQENMLFSSHTVYSPLLAVFVIQHVLYTVAKNRSVID